jgi:hypothetical protein
MILAEVGCVLRADAVFLDTHAIIVEAANVGRLAPGAKVEAETPGRPDNRSASEAALLRWISRPVIALND